MSKFYVGQRVKDGIRMPGRTGVVAGFDAALRYTVKVQWDDGNYDRYTEDGRYLQPYTPTLVNADDEWQIIHKPVVKFEKWERVLVRDYTSEKWKPSIFYQYHKEAELPYETIVGLVNTCWTYCRKWDESLIGKATEE